MSEARPPKPPKLPSIPRWVLYVLVIGVVASWIPLALIALSRSMPSSKPRVHVFMDMDNQPKYKAQATHPLYVDGRAMREPVEGTVARGEARTDDHYWRGYRTDENLEPVQVTVTDAQGNQIEQPDWFDSLPEEIELDEELLRRGQERFNIYCAVCHGEAGYGDGPVQRRVNELNEQYGAGTVTPSWVQPRDLHSDRVRDMADGAIYNTITNGVGTMYGYASQIPVEDRWAIVAYIRALQLSQNAPADRLPPGLRQSLSEPSGGSDAGGESDSSSE